MKRNGFTMVEIVFVVLIIGVLAATAVPKFVSVKDNAKKATELSSASSVAVALEAIKGEWNINESDFDWDGDGSDDTISTDLSYYGYPFPAKLVKNGDDLGALFKSSQKSGFTKQVSTTGAGGIEYAIYTGAASSPIVGVSSEAEISNKPDKNDFWVYIVDRAEASPSCMITDGSNMKLVTVGDFVLFDVNGSVEIDYNLGDLGISFVAQCM